MKLLFDENLSPKLVAALSDLFPASTHLRDLGLAHAADPVVWRYAAEHGFTSSPRTRIFIISAFCEARRPR